MKFARIALVAVALVAAVGAAFLANSMLTSPPPVVEKASTMDTVKVLVAAKDLTVGATVSGGSLEWQDWPRTAVSGRFVTRQPGADAIETYKGATARATIVAGEPILDGKLVKMGEGGFMSAILPTGLRAISVKISPESGAGGFILPNDRVDVILIKRPREGDNRAGASPNSETILSNIRVLAIDQTVEEKNGQRVVVGKTATLELSLRQAETLALSRQLGTLSLALRSLLDASKTAEVDDGLGRKTDVNTVRFGVSTVR